MKFNHNKKRNTAFMYEALIMELSRASMKSEKENKKKIVNVLREFFSRGTILKKELEIYRSFEEVEDLDDEMISKLIQEAKSQFKSMSRKEIFNEQTKLISAINKQLPPSTWTNFIPNYKKLATINQALASDLNPKKQIMAERKLHKLLTKRPLEKRPFPNVNNLAVKTFVEKFNEQYKDSLNESQKKLLEKYITSSVDEDIEFKIYFYQEIDQLKATINEKISSSSGPLSKNLKKVIDRIENYNNRKLDKELLSEVIKIQSLVSEI